MQYNAPLTVPVPAGGPGKGMHSRLYTRILNKHHWVQSCTAVNTTFNDSGLLGIQAGCDPAYTKEMLDELCSEMEAVTRWVGGGHQQGVDEQGVDDIHTLLIHTRTLASPPPLQARV